MKRSSEEQNRGESEIVRGGGNLRVKNDSSLNLLPRPTSEMVTLSKVHRSRASIQVTQSKRHFFMLLVPMSWAFVAFNTNHFIIQPPAGATVGYPREMGQDGERRKTYSAAVIDGCKRTSTIYVGDCIVRKTDTRLSKGKDVVVCLPGARIEHVPERVEKIMGRGKG